MATHLPTSPGEQAAGYLRSLIKQVNGPVTVIRDNLQAHRGKVVHRTIENHPQREVYHLPPYAPELNPIEGLWCMNKHHRMANQCPQQLSELRETARQATDQVAKQTHLLHACIRQARLHHALWPRSSRQTRNCPAPAGDLSCQRRRTGE